MKNLKDNVSVLKGVGPKKQEALSELQINTIFDLLSYYPFRYDDFEVKNINDIVDQEKVTLKGTIASEPTVVHYGRRRNILNIRFLINDDIVKVTFFNQPWLKKQLPVGKEVLIYGRFDKNRSSMAGIKILQSSDSNQMSSIYPTNKHVRQSTIKETVKLAYEEYKDCIFNIVPDDLRNKYKLENLKTVVHDMHFPKTKKEAMLARRTAKFNEFFLFQMRLQNLKSVNQNKGLSIKFDQTKIDQFIDKLPFELTDAQKRVVNEIFMDLKSNRQMNRLLQGDVGSGKTIVAVLGIYACIDAGYQAALMAPTEILAEQHANKLAKLFENTNINVSLLTGNTKQSARKELLPRIKDGEVNLIIGTHALIQDSVEYADLGLAIIDEQHRFGVNQRKNLREKGKGTNVLAMTATPIPRTLAITSYGEMDVSVIDKLPAGRQPVKTSWIRENQFKSVLPFINDRLSSGEQIYVVTPLVEESEAVDMKNAVNIYESFKNIFEPKYQVGLLHGKMNDDEKNSIMGEFQKNNLQILVSTTVIEVGVDVSNATMMIVFNSDHFGLAQLHQLRGRVGRGKNQSYCLLVADPKTEVGAKRMNVMVDSNNGFIISQKDLELRGPGDVMGNAQSGVPDFKVGDPVADLTMLNIAQQEAIQIVSQSDWKTKYSKLFEYVSENNKKIFD
ncbi:ATP-dependent DNA helicase RecG [Apilactobacillus micheneri]|uniref:ATP-dependent DNA helicase RecG n=1 Tax=Apilactobacillus micheneri TaxID=1899430 RepID=A0ABY2YXP2_9LACO|nr:ATP-dependent DNA helicase RecG [Apilactobacillus micheneri]TPR25525.1 ATP-dependent DNA helicase RecG [Apilactobacillus micheneri]TPR26629.1 ATP-dependent DNA helicase RecG [Apilactobacillus micheneri]TPR28416.1 ATP-dependent DNA helicase RecG [Apilactobacillus micheneri]TPR29103.1 ATP-dependent DNA helicase RecG [Apilactobacillus micheneri]TPR30692.1 ATP-dependent DNA helicase RecG [Apilactobacillus micheneri]